MAGSELQIEQHAPFQALTNDHAWSVCPARHHAGRALAAATIVLGLSYATALTGGGPWWGAGALAVLLFSLRRFFFISRFELDAEGVTATYPVTRPVRRRWSDFTRFVHKGEGGLLIEPGASGIFSKRPRGLTLFFAPDDAESPRAVAQHMAQHAADGVRAVTDARPHREALAP